MTLPGFIFHSGSQIRLNSRMAWISSGPYCFSSSSARCCPSPCSPDSDPPYRTTRSAVPSNHRRRRWSAVLVPGEMVGAVNTQRQGARLVMTTHDPRGGGRPRLIFAFGGTASQHDSQREFDLLPGVTVIGSGPDADLRLEGLAARHAEIRRDERDEYVYIDLGSEVWPAAKAVH